MAFPVVHDSKITDGEILPSFVYGPELKAFPSPVSSPLPENDGPTTPDRALRRVCSVIFGFYTIGWADAVLGVILPRVTAEFDLEFTRSSLLFLMAAAGYFVGTFIVEPLVSTMGFFPLSATRRPLLPSLLKRKDHKYVHSISQGRCWSFLLAGLLQAVFLLMTATARSLPVILVAFFLGGMARSILIAVSNAYVVKTARYIKLGQLHGAYGVGALSSPLVCQTLLAHGWQWEKFYFISLGLTLLNCISLVFSFHSTKGEFENDKQQSLGPIEPPKDIEESKSDALDDGFSPEPSLHQYNTMRTTIRTPLVWFFALFVFFYCGAENLTHGFIVSLLLDARSANPDTAGYVASGFWAGLALGRISLGYVTPHMGHRKRHLVACLISWLMLVELAGGIICHSSIWAINSFVIDAIFASIAGLMIGPIYPTTLEYSTDLLPAELHLTALALMSSCAVWGSGIFPFTAGILASAKGVLMVEPYVIAVLGCMAIIWFAMVYRPWK